jgi:hypothetical protein
MYISQALEKSIFVLWYPPFPGELDVYRFSELLGPNLEANYYGIN